MEPDLDLSSIWPLYDIELVTERLTLRSLRGDDVFRLGQAASLGIHDPEMNPFLVDWAQKESPELEREMAKYYWGQMATWQPGSWNLSLVVRHEGSVVGLQDVGASNFSELKQVLTGSWLAKPWQGQGLGKEMRRAVLDFAFHGLGAEQARSGAREDNPASLGVSESLGYRRDGKVRLMFGEQPGTEIRLLMDRDTWLASDHSPAQMTGLTPECLAMFGL